MCFKTGHHFTSLASFIDLQLIFVKNSAIICCALRDNTKLCFSVVHIHSSSSSVANEKIKVFVIETIQQL